MATETRKRLGVNDLDAVLARLKAGERLRRSGWAGKYTTAIGDDNLTEALWDRVSPSVRFDKETESYVLKTPEWKSEEARRRSEAAAELERHEQAIRVREAERLATWRGMIRATTTDDELDTVLREIYRWSATSSALGE